jgi:hypothetical protein
MNRRTLKKQIPQLAERLTTPALKYLVATSKVHPDIIFRYERQLEIRVLDLMRVYLILDPSWPHRARWLDGVSEEFTWERKSPVVYGSGKLFWGHWPEVSREITGLSLKVSIQLCSKHSVDYLFRYGDSDIVRSYSSRRWCLMPTRV